MITDQQLSVPVMLSAICTEYKITQGQLANELGYAQETISRWINGHSEPPKSIRDALKGIELRLLKNS